MKKGEDPGGGGSNWDFGTSEEFQKYTNQKPKDKKAPLELVHGLSTFIDLNY